MCASVQVLSRRWRSSVPDDEHFFARLGGGEELAQRHPQGLRDLVQRAERRRDLAVLELRDEAGGEARLRGERTHRDVSFGAQAADVFSDDVGIDDGAHDVAPHAGPDTAS